MSDGSVTDVGEFSREIEGGGHQTVCHEGCAVSAPPHQVPEPASITVFALGLMALFIITRWRRA